MAMNKAQTEQPMAEPKDRLIPMLRDMKKEFAGQG
jgi:hypothetical protein